MREFIKNLAGKNIRLQFRKIFPSGIQKSANNAAKAEALSRSKFYSKFVNSGDICFDVGANIGNRVAPLLMIGARVVAVEPQADCQEQLKQRFGKKITIIGKGLGEKESVKKFYVSNGSVLSSFSEEWINSVKEGRFNEYTWNEPIELEMTTADKLIETYGLPSFIKIDVEGYEPEVLKGLTHPVKMISFEYTVPEQIEKAIQCIDLVLKHNPNIECNYSESESMQWSMEKWLSPGDMKIFMAGEEFINTAFGDIYVRTKVN